MVYKFCSYIDTLLSVDYANDYLDLVALGEIADVVDLRDFETRHLVKRGINNIKNPFIKRMVEQQAFSLKDEITPFGIAFYIAPYINATIRTGSQDEKLLLFKSMLDHQGYQEIPSTKRGCKGQVETIVEQACRNCVNLKNRQTKTRDDSLNIIERKIENENLLKNKILIVPLNSEETIDSNLVGLIANELMSKYQKPTLLIQYQSESKSWAGSGRGLSRSNFTNFKDFINNSNLGIAQGHQGAFGIIISEDKLNEFIDYCNFNLKDYKFTPTYKVDKIFNKEFKEDEILKVAEFKGIWGNGIEEPLFAIENINISKDNLKLMSANKNPTLKITLPNGVDLIKFKSSEEEFQQLYSELGCVIINIVGKCERNIWNGIISPQIIIEAYEIVAKTEYYF